MEVLAHNIVRDLDTALNCLQNDTVIGFDLETSGLSPWRHQIATVQLYGFQSSTAVVLQVRGFIHPKLKSFLEEAHRLFIGHNLVGFDMQFLSTHEVNIRRMNVFDTLVAETVLANQGRRDVSRSLRATLKRRLGAEVNKDIDHDFWLRPDLTDDQLLYAISDVLHLPALRQTQLDKASETGQSKAIELEMAIVPYVAMMSINGMPFHVPTWQRKYEEQTAERALRLGILETVFPEVTNFNSPVQVKKALNARGVNVTSTAAGVLEELALMGGESGKWARYIVDYRRPTQFLKMYSPEWVGEYVVGNIVHSHYWQCGTDTTRFASSDPNLQQVTREHRDMFRAPDGHKVVKADLSQIEVRVAAGITRDERLLRAIEEEDIHTEVAVELFDLLPEQVTKEIRRTAKATTFTLIFGGYEGAMLRNAKVYGADITYKQAKEIRRKFLERFPGMARAIERAEDLATNYKGPIVLSLPSGHKRVLVGPKKKSTVVLNTMVQGTAAAGMKYDLLEMGRRGLDNYLGAQVHDEYVAPWVPDREVEDYRRELEDAMVEGFSHVTSAKVVVESTVDQVWKS